MEHTKTPWTYETLKDGTRDNLIEITGPLAGFVVSPSYMTETNAAFTVRAVNSYDELVEALGEMITIHNHEDPKCTCAQIRVARAALKLAKGE